MILSLCALVDLGAEENNSSSLEMEGPLPFSSTERNTYTEHFAWLGTEGSQDVGLPC